MKTDGDNTVPQPTPVHLVPATIFVAATGTVPRGLRPADTGMYVEGLVDEFSPFPAEQTCWGYLREPGTEEVFFFATWRDTLAQYADPGDSHATYIVPKFLALAARADRKPGWVFIADDNGVAALHFPNRGRVPDQLHTRFLADGQAGLVALWQLRNAMQKEICGDDDVADGLYRCPDAELARGKTLAFALEFSENENRAFKPHGKRRLGPESFIYTADVRDTSFLANERRKRKAARTLTRLALGAAALLALLIVAQIYIWLQESRAAGMVELSDLQAPLVDELSQKEALIGVVKRYRGYPLRPFDWLMAANMDRPIDLSFASVKMDRAKAIHFAGEAPDVTAVNRYHDALVATGQFAKVEISSLNSNQGVVEFGMAMEMPALKLPPRQSPIPTVSDEAVPDAGSTVGAAVADNPQSAPDAGAEAEAASQ